MPSPDEQITWEDITDFPDQILPRERSQTILDNLRNEHRRLQKQSLWRKYGGLAAKGIITCAVLLAIIIIKPFTASIETSGSTATIDQTYMAAAQQAIKALGIRKEYHFDEIEKEQEYDIVRTKNREAIVTFKPNTTEVRTVSATVAVDELTNRYQPYVSTAQDAVKETKQPVVFQTAHFFKDKEGTNLSFSLEDRQYVEVDLQTNKVSRFLLYYKVEDLDKKYVSIAQNALMAVSGKDHFTFTSAKKSSEKQEEMWTLSNEQEAYSVTMGAKTGQVYRVNDVTDRYKIKSINEVIPVTQPLIKNVFGIDISGYKAYGGMDWGGYVLKSQGKPNVVISLENLNIGNIHSIRIE